MCCGIKDYHTLRIPCQPLERFSQCKPMCAERIFYFNQRGVCHRSHRFYPDLHCPHHEPHVLGKNVPRAAVLHSMVAHLLGYRLPANRLFKKALGIMHDTCQPEKRNRDKILL